MVFLIKQSDRTKIERKLRAFNYVKTGEGSFIRLKYPLEKYPYYKVELKKDAMERDLLVRITMETLPENRYIKGKDLVIYHRGTFVEEELSRIVNSLI